MQEDINVLRKLIWEYIRPVVLIDELPWNELNIGGELTLKCSDPGDLA